ncbi:hypothetical protein ACQR1W_01915 [Bradyrhizobium sp. HKCCYLS1011]|uniref:hypothetical protein n=1 Tax=Bradyrhizobium sp. HKCCYLS1011 TaxID=3420733 RepID=UPI003EB69CBE
MSDKQQSRPAGAVAKTLATDRAAANYKPGQTAPNRREEFAALNRFITERGGWITSIPAAPEIAMECLEGSALPDELRALGYRLKPAGEGERIIAGTITERLSLTSCGVFEPLVDGSTKTIVRFMRHAGIHKVKRYSFDMP